MVNARSRSLIVILSLVFCLNVGRTQEGTLLLKDGSRLSGTPVAWKQGELQFKLSGPETVLTLNGEDCRHWVQPDQDEAELSPRIFLLNGGEVPGSVTGTDAETVQATFPWGTPFSLQRRDFAGVQLWMPKEQMGADSVQPSRAVRHRFAGELHVGKREVSRGLTLPMGQAQGRSRMDLVFRFPDQRGNLQLDFWVPPGSEGRTPGSIRLYLTGKRANVTHMETGIPSLDHVEIPINRKSVRELEVSLFSDWGQGTFLLVMDGEVLQKWSIPNAAELAKTAGNQVRMSSLNQQPYILSLYARRAWTGFQDHEVSVPSLVFRNGDVLSGTLNGLNKTGWLFSLEGNSLPPIPFDRMDRYMEQKPGTLQSEPGEWRLRIRNSGESLRFRPDQLQQGVVHGRVPGLVGDIGIPLIHLGVLGFQSSSSDPSGREGPLLVLKDGSRLPVDSWNVIQGEQIRLKGGVLKQEAVIPLAHIARLLPGTHENERLPADSVRLGFRNGDWVEGTLLGMEGDDLLFQPLIGGSWQIDRNVLAHLTIQEENLPLASRPDPAEWRCFPEKSQLTSAMSPRLVEDGGLRVETGIRHYARYRSGLPESGRARFVFANFEDAMWILSPFDDQDPMRNPSCKFYIHPERLDWMIPGKSFKFALPPVEMGVVRTLDIYWNLAERKSWLYVNGKSLGDPVPLPKMPKKTNTWYCLSTRSPGHIYQLEVLPWSGILPGEEEPKDSLWMEGEEGGSLNVGEGKRLFFQPHAETAAPADLQTLSYLEGPAEMQKPLQRREDTVVIESPSFRLSCTDVNEQDGALTARIQGIRTRVDLPKENCALYWNWHAPQTRRPDRASDYLLIAK